MTAQRIPKQRQEVRSIRTHSRAWTRRQDQMRANLDAQAQFGRSPCRAGTPGIGRPSATTAVVSATLLIVPGAVVRVVERRVDRTDFSQAFAQCRPLTEPIQQPRDSI